MDISYLNLRVLMITYVSRVAGPYCPLSTIGTVPRVYDILGPTKACKAEKYK
jgi:hypothetical protein